MTDSSFAPDIRRCYAPQPGPFLCWAAAALVLWRARHGATGRGESIETLLASEDNPRFDLNRRFADALVERALRDLVDYDTADAMLREEIPEFVEAVPGLPFEQADDFFLRFLGARATPLGRRPGALDPDDREAVKRFIRERAPFVVFHRLNSKIGHLQLVVGYRDDPAPGLNSPAVFMFDPEGGEHAMPWARFRATILEQLVTPRVYSY